MRALFLVLLFACGSAPAPEVTLRPAPLPSAQPTARGSLQPAPPSYAWDWRGDKPGFGVAFYHQPRSARDGALECTFTYDEPSSLARTACSRAGTALWRNDEPNAFVADAALVLQGDTLYEARYSDISSGCILHAFDATTGALRWRTNLQGLGPIAHSEYLNAVEVRMIGVRVVVFGWESAGRYVEVVDAATGKTAHHEILPMAP